MATVPLPVLPDSTVLQLFGFMSIQIIVNTLLYFEVCKNLPSYLASTHDRPRDGACPKTLNEGRFFEQLAP